MTQSLALVNGVDRNDDRDDDEKQLITKANKCIDNSANDVNEKETENASESYTNDDDDDDDKGENEEDDSDNDNDNDKSEGSEGKKTNEGQTVLYYVAHWCNLLRNHSTLSTLLGLDHDYII